MSLIKLGLTFRDYNINIELLDTKTTREYIYYESNRDNQ